MAIRAIDQKRGGMPNEGHFYERKIALLAKEDQIEADFEKMVPNYLEYFCLVPSPIPMLSGFQFFSTLKCWNGSGDKIKLHAL